MKFPRIFGRKKCVFFERRLLLVMIFSALAMGVTFYLGLKHYEPTLGTFCNINAFFDCDTVNKSEYSKIFGIPVAILGFLSYIFIFVVSLLMYREFDFSKLKINPYGLLIFLLGFAIFGTLFSLYLSYAEFFILEKVCLLCLAQQILIILILIILLTLTIHVRTFKKCKHCYRYFFK